MIDLGSVEEAMEVMRRQFPPTPMIFSEHFSRITGAHVYLKLENLQRTGSFKVRGAANKVARCRGEIGAKGVVAASAGNHAQGVALAASRAGVPAVVVMPETAPISKQLSTRGYGAQVILAGRTVADALARAAEFVEEGYFFVHPFDDEDVMAGQGTVGLEILAQAERFDEVWVPVGGGGLISGIATAVKSRRPEVQVVGVQTEACPSAREALRSGRPVEVPMDRTIADGILVSKVGERPFAVLSRLVDRMLTVEESRIAMTIVQLLEKKKLLAEGAGIVGLAALLAAEPGAVKDRTIVVVVSGGNVDLNVLDRVLEQGLIRTGRILRFQVVLDDVPGALRSLLGVLSEKKANILHILHDRLSLDLPLGRSRVEVAAETRGAEHIEELLAALTERGFTVDARV